MANIYDMVDTWTNFGTTYTAIKMSVTNTASTVGVGAAEPHGGRRHQVLRQAGRQRRTIVTTTPAATLDVNGTFATSSAERLALVNGRNDGVATPAFALCRITGPTAAYQISGICRAASTAGASLSSTPWPRP